MMLTIRYVMFSTALLSFWCSSHVLPAAHAQAPVTEAEQAVRDAQRKVQAAKTDADKSKAQAKAAKAAADEAQDEVDAAAQERDLAQVIADKKKATFQNATGLAEPPAEQAFVLAATALNVKQRNLASAIRAQQSKKEDQDAAENDAKTKNQALTEAQATLEKAKAAYEALQKCPDIKECDPLQCNTKTVECLTQCIKKDPCDFESLLCRGDAYLCKCLPSAAEIDFREVLRWDPDNVRALVGWARAAADQQCWHTAIQRYNRAVPAAERAMQPVVGVLYCDTDDLRTYLYRATCGRAYSHLNLARGNDATTCEVETMVGGDEEAAQNRALVQSEAALRDFSQAILYAPCAVKSECIRRCIALAEGRCEDHRSALKEIKSKRASKSSAY
jgi:tetratricopeptide (TPR) repeat protein